MQITESSAIATFRKINFDESGYVSFEEILDYMNVSGKDSAAAMAELELFAIPGCRCVRFKSNYASSASMCLKRLLSA